MSAPTSTADRVLAALAPFDLRPAGAGRWRGNSPLRAGSDSHSFTLRIDGPEHGAYYDHVSQAHGSLYQLAELLGLGRPAATARPADTVYTYTDAAGAPLFAVVRSYRHGAKQFYQRRPDGRNGRGGAPLVLYHLPEVRAAVAAGETIYIVEGEKDVETLRLFGLAATCNAGGAEKWTAAAYSAALRGADVVILPDNDPPGERHAAQVAQALAGVARRVRQVRLPDLPPKGDVSDWIAAGHTLAELLALVAAAAPEEPPDVGAGGGGSTHLGGLVDLPDRRHPARGAPEPQRSAPATLVHASQIGAVVPPITWLIPGILGRNALAQLFGPGGSGKSYLALDQALCVAQVAPVVYIAAEAAGEQQDRVAAWCAHHQRGIGDLYFWPQPIALKDPASVEAFLAEVRPLRPALIIVDPLAACMVGLEESSTGDMTIAVDALNRIREATGAAVNIVHHTGWSTDHERGSSVLRNACRVVLKLLTDDNGLMTLTCEKANNGPPFEARYFRQVAAGPGVTPIPASKATTRNSALTLKHIAILEALSLAQHRDGASFTQILDYTEQHKSTLHKGINRLLERGLIERQRQIYSITEEGQAELATAAAITAFASSPGAGDGELTVNWQVCAGPDGAGQTGDSPHQGAEFTEFTAQAPAVHPERAHGRSAPFTAGIASGRASSPEFTASSPDSSPAQFTSSPCAPPLWGAGGEQRNDAPPPTAPSSPTMPRTTPPPGATLLRCDHKGNPTTYGAYWRIRLPDGRETDPEQHQDAVIHEAWRILEGGTIALGREDGRATS